MFFSPSPNIRLLNTLNLFRTALSSESPSPAAEQSAPLISPPPKSRPANHATNLKTNHRPNPRANSKTKIRGNRRINADVRVQIQTSNALRKQRSFRTMERDRSVHTLPDVTAGCSEFPALYRKVKLAFASSTVPATEEEQVFCQELEKLGLDYVRATTAVDPQRAEEVRAERENILALLEKERRQFDRVASRRREEEEERKRRKKREDRVRLEKEKRKAKDEARRKKKLKKLGEKEEEERRRLVEERRSTERERLARLEVERLLRLEEQRRAQIEEERRARIREEHRRVELEREAERHRLMRESAEAAKRFAEHHATQEAHARQAAEQAAHRARIEAEARLQAQMDEMERLKSEARLNAAMDTRLRQEIEERYRAHVAEYARMQAHFQAQEEEVRRTWYFCHAQQQQNVNECYAPSEDILMRNPSYVTSNGDVSMSSIHSDSTTVPSPLPYIPPPQPTTIEEWFALYDTRWQDIRSSPEPTLTFAHFPWPVFRFINTLDDLTDEDIKLFFSKKYPHPRKLDKAWKEDLRRWHTDKLGLFVSRIRPEWVEQVQEGFLRCIRVMTVFQSEKGIR